MINGESILAAVLSLRDATEQSFRRLETAMARGFDDVARRFEKVDGRFEGLDGRVGTLETRLGALATRLGALETRLERFEIKVLARFDTLDARLIAFERG